VHLDTDLRLRDLPILPEGSPFSARLKSSVNGQIDPEAPSLSGELSLRATEISGLPEEAELLLGQEPKMLADLSVSPQSVEIHKAQLDSRTKGTLTGAHNLDTGLFQSEFTLALSDLQSGQLRVAHGFDPARQGLGHICRTLASISLPIPPDPCRHPGHNQYRGNHRPEWAAA
jgi:hypothetical protein